MDFTSLFDISQKRAPDGNPTRHTSHRTTVFHQSQQPSQRLSDRPASHRI